MVEDRSPAALKERALRLLEDVLITFGATESEELFSDTPIRMTVWRMFAEDPAAPRNLLIELNNRMRAADALRKLRADFGDGPRLLGIGEIVLVRANMDDMIRKVLPATYWFRALPPEGVRDWRIAVERAATAPSYRALCGIVAASPMKTLWRFLVAWVVIRQADALHDGREDRRWSVVAELCEALLQVSSLSPPQTPAQADAVHLTVTAFLATLVDTYTPALDRLETLQQDSGPAVGAPVWSIDLSRPTDMAVAGSRRTVKIDAAENVFRVSTRGVTWAVIDSGIDARHMAFANGDGAGPEASRVVATYDFNRLLALLTEDWERLLPPSQMILARDLLEAGKDDGPADLPDAVLSVALGMGDEGDGTAPPASCGALQALIGSPEGLKRARRYYTGIRTRITQGETLDWPLLEPLLRVPQASEFYVPPGNGHGTHVAGILAGHLGAGVLPDGAGPPAALSGMCPEMRLFDLRVTDERGRSDEFLVMAALQFVAWLNRTRDRLIVHGANLSLQIRHQVRSFGCGQTPVCREANRLVDSGVVVVAAAGNTGFNTLRASGMLVDAYAVSSIMDPGNADKVITVGSTHRERPHTYGVSYFSSRGPTADGRAKPDLVAPGEKITAPAPGQALQVDTGTSMAAPHVSGAAAMIMARHPEFIGHPQRIKDILCRSATDLGRERAYQGAGLVDVLRALESV